MDCGIGLTIMAYDWCDGVNNYGIIRGRIESYFDSSKRVTGLFEYIRLSKGCSLERLGLET